MPTLEQNLNDELSDVARNTNDIAKARRLIGEGAKLSSTNGPHWRHTPLHQAAYHGRYEMAKALIELKAPLHQHPNPCGRGSTGTPLELARGGGHHAIAEMIEAAMQSKPGSGGGSGGGGGGESRGSRGVWAQYSNIDMCGQGDVEIIGDWKRKHSIDDLKHMVEER